MYRIDNWINEGSVWIVESIDGEYVKISAYSPLVGNTYIELLDELKNSMKRLINIKNNDNKCFLWCHVRNLNLVERNPQRKTWLINLITKELIFLFQRKIMVELKCKIKFVLMCFVMTIN